MDFVQSPDRGFDEDQWQQPENVQQHFGQAYPQPPQQQWRLQPRAARTVGAGQLAAPEQAAAPGQAGGAGQAAAPEQTAAPGRAAWGLRPQQPGPRASATGAGTGGGAPGWRWVAHPPYGAPGAPPHPVVEQQWRQRRRLLEDFRRRSEPSPRYARPPRWGLPHVAVRPLDQGHGDPGDIGARRTGPGGARAGAQESAAGTGDVLADRAALGDRAAACTAFLMRAATWLVVAGVVAAVIGWGRYGLLVALRGQVVPVWVQWLSAGAVYLANAAAFVVSLLVLVVLVQWLRAVRERWFHPRRDLRGRWELAAQVVIPGLNLLYLPVLAQEAAVFGARDGGDGDPRTRRWARTAWGSLAAGQLVGCLYWWQLLAPGTQAAANALSLGAAMAVLAALAAWALRRALQSSRGDRRPRRLVYVGPGTGRNAAAGAEGTGDAGAEGPGNPGAEGPGNPGATEAATAASTPESDK